MTYKSQTLSAVVITHNNAATLEKALSSLKWVDDLIVVDMGSTDGTINIARHFTKRVYYHPSKYLNMVKRDAFSTVKGDWILWIEPDEWVEEMLRHEIDGILLNTPTHLNGFRIPCQLKFQNRTISVALGHNAKRQLRLVRKNEWQVEDDWFGTLKVNGNIGKLDRSLECEPYSQLDALFASINTASTNAAYQWLEQHGTTIARAKPYTLLLKAKLAACQALFLERGIFQGAAGISIALAKGLLTFLTLAKVRSLLVKT